jgi:hypothetical protein
MKFAIVINRPGAACATVLTVTDCITGGMEKTAAPPTYRRLYNSTRTQRDFVAPEVVHDPIRQRPDRMPRTVFAQLQLTPWKVNYAGRETRYPTEEEARTAAGGMGPDAYETFVHEANKSDIGPFEAVRKFLDEKGIEYTSNVAKTGSQYVKIPSLGNLELRFADHSTVAPFGSNSRGAWDFKKTMDAQMRQRLASALRIIDEEHGGRLVGESASRLSPEQGTRQRIRNSMENTCPTRSTSVPPCKGTSATTQIA